MEAHLQQKLAGRRSQPSNREYVIGAPQIGNHRAVLRAFCARETGDDRLPSPKKLGTRWAQLKLNAQIVNVYAGKCWSREWELNPRPADYESAALPLSYLGPYLPGVFASGAFMAAVKHAAQ
jgi:hypothetical protein